MSMNADMGSTEFAFDEYTERLALSELSEALEVDRLKTGLSK